MPELMEILAKAEMEISAASTVTVAFESWTPLTAWDNIPLARGAALTPDLASGGITVHDSGPYSAMLMLNCAFDRQEEVSVGFSINGVEPTRWLQEQGRGTSKPIDFSYYGIQQLTAGDVVTVVMKLETADGDVEVLSGTFTMAKEF